METKDPQTPAIEDYDLIFRDPRIADEVMRGVDRKGQLVNVEASLQFALAAQEGLVRDNMKRYSYSSEMVKSFLKELEANPCTNGNLLNGIQANVALVDNYENIFKVYKSILKITFANSEKYKATIKELELRLQGVEVGKKQA